jgi:hypothetical protein
MFRHIVVIGILGFVTSSLLVAQQRPTPGKVSPVVSSSTANSPKSDGAAATSAPSLDETMTWLKEKVESEGGYSFTVTLTTTHNDGSPTETNNDGGPTIKYAFRNADACKVNIGVANLDVAATANVDLSALSQDSVKVQHFDLVKWLNVKEDIGGGSGKYGFNSRQTVQAASDYWSITGLKPDGPTMGKAWHDTETLYDLVFADPQMAERVAKAFNHAIELCGGAKSKPEPF